jgi:hypothetical protein
MSQLTSINGCDAAEAHGFEMLSNRRGPRTSP